MFNPSKGFMGGNGIVGGGIPLALGAAFAARYKNTDSASVVFFGDGASNQGTFHESLNLAALKRLPLIAVCENNRYAATTPVAFSTTDEDMTKRAASYGIPALSVDGNDVECIIEAITSALIHVRSGEGPFLLDCKTYRIEPHCGIIADIRPEKEREEWQTSDRDPLNIIISRYPGIFGNGILHSLEKEINDEIENAVTFSRQSDYPVINVFAEEFRII
jgi:pyruvate dehydrogenase E1 component alpha subunit